MPEFKVRIEQSTYDEYLVEASSEGEARALAHEIHCEHGLQAPCYVGGAVEEQHVFCVFD